MYNIYMLKDSQRNRLILSLKENAQYFLTNYRFQTEEDLKPLGKEDHAIEVDGMKILGIYKLDSKDKY